MLLKQSTQVKFYNPMCKQEQWEWSDDNLLLLWVILIKENIKKKKHGLLTVLKQNTVLLLVTHYEQKLCGSLGTNLIYFSLHVASQITSMCYSHNSWIGSWE